MTLRAQRHPRHERILRAARDLFVTVGYPNTSMEMIAQDAQVVRATIYNNFTDKEGVLAAIMQDYLDGYAAIPDRLRERSSPGDSSFSLIERLIAEAVQLRLDNADLQPLVELCKHLRVQDWYEANARADDAMERWLLEVHLRDAEQGMLRSGIDIQFATSALYGMIETVLASFPVGTASAGVPGVVRQLALLHWHALYSVDPPADRPDSSAAVEEALNGAAHARPSIGDRPGAR